MIMEAFEKGGERFDYEISGHSGDSPNIVFIKGDKPANNAERLKILQKMVAHTQYCYAGDCTLEACGLALDEVC